MRKLVGLTVAIALVFGISGCDAISEADATTKRLSDLTSDQRARLAAAQRGQIHEVDRPYSGLVTLTFRSLNSFMRRFSQIPRGFYRRAMSGDGADYRSH